MFNTPFAFNGFQSFPGFNPAWNQGTNTWPTTPWNSAPSFGGNWAGNNWPSANWGNSPTSTPWNWNTPSFNNSFGTPFSGTPSFNGFNGFNGFGFNPTNAWNGFNIPFAGQFPSPFGTPFTSQFGNQFANPFASQFAGQFGGQFPGQPNGQFPSPFGFNWWNAESTQPESNTPYNYNPFAGVTPATTQAA